MQTEYFVDYKLHNGANGGWAFKTTMHTTDLTKATKEYHHQLDTYIDVQDFDFVQVTLSDMYGNSIKSEYWKKEVEPVVEEA